MTQKVQPIENAELRRRAEERLEAKTGTAPPPNVTGEETLRLHHELQVHQVELEMQNAELRHTRDELESALEQYTDLYDFAPVSYFTLDHKGTINRVNLTGAVLVGVERSRLVGRTFGVLITDDTRPDFTVFLGKVFMDPGKVTCEVALLQEKNTPLYAQVEGVSAASGQECRIALIDITEHKRAEEVLRESEERLHLLIDGAKDYGIFMLDVDGCVTSWNEGAKRLKGWDTQEILGRYFSQFYTKEAVAAHQPELGLEIAKAKGRYEEEGWRVRKDGSKFMADVIITAIRDESGKLRGYSKVTRDITERKRLESEIQDAREYAENIVETVIKPLVVLNFDLKILTANHSFYDTFKVTPEATIGNFIYDLGNGQWDIPKLRVLFEKILPQKTVLNGYEVEHDFLDIGFKIILLNARQIFRENIGSNIILLVMEDITDRKRAEEEIKRLNISLAERADELETANKELGAFNHTVAHDLRQPLNLLGLYCQSINLLCKDQLKKECMGYVQDAHKATLRMNSLIGALLNFSQMGRIEPRREMVDLSMLAHEVSKSLQLTEPGRQVDFKIADEIVVNGDAGLLRSVLDNLLGNAWKYTSMKEKAVIEFGVSDIDWLPTYFVRDNGGGFDKADADKLFTPFHRLPEAEKYKGFGIGLATVERIIQRHGGKIWAEGERGKGACFYFTLDRQGLGTVCKSASATTDA